MFKKLLAYFLLLNFLNTLFFPELPLPEYLPLNTEKLAASETDEIDSMVEFVAEYCLDLGDDFSESDLEDQTDNSTSRTFIKDFLLPEKLVFGFLAENLPALQPAFKCRFPVNFFEIDAPPPRLALV